MEMKEYTSIKIRNYTVAKLDKVLQELSLSRQNYFNIILDKFSEEELKNLYFKAIRLKGKNKKRT